MHSLRVYAYLPLVCCCIAIFIFYQTLIYSSPTIYWDDPHIRWALRDKIVLEAWLPMIQIFVKLSSRISSSLYMLKTLMSLLAIGSLLAVYLLARLLFSSSAGLVATIFLGFNMMFAALAIVPYADVLFLGLAFLAFYFLNGPYFTHSYHTGLVILNLASLTSYSGWFLSFIFIATWAITSIRTLEWKEAVFRTLKLTAFCSIAPLAWLTFGIPGLGNLMDRLWSVFEFIAAPAASSFSQHILERLNHVYIWDFSVQYFQLLLWQVPLEFLSLALAGIMFAMMDGSHRVTHLQILSFLLLHWIVLALFQPWKFGSLRQTFLLQSFLLLYAAYGLVKGIHWLFNRLLAHKLEKDLVFWRSQTVALGAVLFALGTIPTTARFVIANSWAAPIVTPFEISQWLNVHLSPNDAVLVLDDTDYYPYALATYTEIPLEQILDDRLNSHFLQENLESAKTAYIVELYTSRAGLSHAEERLLQELESGRLPARKVKFGAASVWYAAAEQVHYFP